MCDHSNAEWLEMLRAGDNDSALSKLRNILRLGLSHALSNYHNVSNANVENFVQDALLKILDSLDSFHGKSRFTTWAMKIGVSVSLTELRLSSDSKASLAQKVL